MFHFTPSPRNIPNHPKSPQKICTSPILHLSKISDRHVQIGIVRMGGDGRLAYWDEPGEIAGFIGGTVCDQHHQQASSIVGSEDVGCLGLIVHHDHPKLCTDNMRKVWKLDSKYHSVPYNWAVWCHKESPHHKLACADVYRLNDGECRLRVVGCEDHKVSHCVIDNVHLHLHCNDIGGHRGGVVACHQYVMMQVEPSRDV